MFRASVDILDVDEATMGAYIRNDKPGIAEDVEKIFTIFPRLRERRLQAAGTMSGGERQMVALGRALMAKPSLLMLDEPMAGMNVEEKEDMSRFILDVNDEFGTTIALIEHDMGVVMDLSDRVVVMDYGKKIGDGAPDEVRRLVLTASGGPFRGRPRAEQTAYGVVVPRAVATDPAGSVLRSAA